jgi:hypothetical protein
MKLSQSNYRETALPNPLPKGNEKALPKPDGRESLPLRLHVLRLP